MDEKRVLLFSGNRVNSNTFYDFLYANLDDFIRNSVGALKGTFFGLKEAGAPNEECTFAFVMPKYAWVASIDQKGALIDDDSIAIKSHASKATYTLDNGHTVTQTIEGVSSGMYSLTLHGLSDDIVYLLGDQMHQTPQPHSVAVFFDTPEIGEQYYNRYRCPFEIGHTNTFGLGSGDFVIFQTRFDDPLHNDYDSLFQFKWTSSSCIMD